MTYWIYWTIFSVLAFGVAGFIIKLLWDIRNELYKINSPKIMTAEDVSKLKDKVLKYKFPTQ